MSISVINRLGRTWVVKPSAGIEYIRLHEIHRFSVCTSRGRRKSGYWRVRHRYYPYYSATAERLNCLQDPYYFHDHVHFAGRMY